MPTLQEMLDSLKQSAPSFFYADRPTGPGSYEALQTRRKIAESLLGKRSPFPKNLGEGLTYAGERFADVMTERDLQRREAEDEERLQTDARNYRTALEEAARKGTAPPTPPATPDAPAPQAAATPVPPRDMAPEQPPATPSPQPGRSAIASIIASRTTPRADVSVPSMLTAPTPLAAKPPAAGTPDAMPPPAPPPPLPGAEPSAPPMVGPEVRPSRFPAQVQQLMNRGRALPYAPDEPAPREGLGIDQSVEFGQGRPAPAGPVGNAPNRFFRPMTTPGGTNFVPTQPAPDRFSTRAFGPLPAVTSPDQPSDAMGAISQALGNGPQPSQALPFASVEGNPPIPTDIPPAPTRVAQASTAQLSPGAPAPTSRYGTPRGPLEQPLPEPAPQSAGGVTQPQQRTVLPPPPVAQNPGPEEINAMVNARASRDPLQQQRWSDVAAMYAARRKEDYERRKTVWDFMARTREAEDLATYNEAMKQRDPKYVRELRNADIKATQEAEDRRLGGTLAEATTFLTKPYEDVKPMLKATDNLRLARATTDKMWAGLGAMNLQQMSRFLAELPGGRPQGEYATAGELFAAYMRQAVGPMRAQMGLSGNTSNFDLENMLRAIGADTTLQRGTVQALLDQGLRANFDGIRSFLSQRASFAGDSEDRQQKLHARFHVDVPAHLPAEVIEKFKRNYADDPQQAVNGLDEWTFTPGAGRALAQRLKLGR